MKDEYKHLVGKVVEFKSPFIETPATDCFVANIDYNKGITIMGVHKGEQKKIFCIRKSDGDSALAPYDDNFKWLIEAIESGVIDGASAPSYDAEMRASGDIFSGGQPSCAFEQI